MRTTLKFDIGDRVRISETSEFNYQGKDKSGERIEGEIYSLNNQEELETEGFDSEQYYYDVNWSNSSRNSYTEKDLEFWIEPTSEGLMDDLNALLDKLK